MSLWNPTELRELAEAYVAGSLDTNNVRGVAWSTDGKTLETLHNALKRTP